MDIYFCNFFQGLPFIVLITFLFITKRGTINIVWFYLSFPTFLYFILVKFGHRIFYYLCEGIIEYSLLWHIISLNIGFALWLLHLIEKDYSMDVFCQTVAKKYFKKIKQEKYKYYNVSWEVLCKLIEEISDEMWYVFIPEKDKKFLIRHNIFEIRGGKEFINSFYEFSEKKAEYDRLEEKFYLDKYFGL